MAKQAGVITINLAAGTSQLVLDLEKAKAKVRDFGSSVSAAGTTGKASMASTSAALRELEGNFGNNNRAIARFIGSTMGLGSALQMAFPIVGGLAFGTMIVELGGKVNQFFKDLREAPGKTAEAFQALNVPLEQTNDELRTANDRLDNEIAKLLGKPQNNLKIAIDEVREANDKLIISLQKSVTEVEKLLKEHHTTLMQHVTGGMAGTEDIEKMAHEFDAKINKITGDAQESIRSASRQGNDKAIPGIQEGMTKDLRDAYGKFIPLLTGKIDDALKPHPAAAGTIFEQYDNPAERANRLAMANGLREFYEDQSDKLGLTVTNEKKKGTVSALQTNAENQKLELPFANRMEALNTELKAAQSKLEAAGLGEAAKVMAKAFGEAQKAIDETNKELVRLHAGPLTDSEADLIRTTKAETAATDAETVWKTKLAETTAQIKDRVKAQELLTAAIGKGYEAQRRASVEIQVMEKVGAEHYNDPKWMAKPENAAHVAGIRAGFNAEAEAKHGEQTAAGVDSLQQEINLQNLLTAAQKQGEEEIRRITALDIWRQGILKGESSQEIVLQITKYYGAIRLEQEKRIDQTAAETEAVEKLSAAELQGAEAARKQALENKYTAMERAGQGAEVPGMRKYDEAADQAKDTKQVAARVNIYSDELEKLNQERDKLISIIGEQKASADQARALRDLEQDRLRILAQQQLAIGTAKAQVRAFFYDMQADAEKAGRVIYDTLTSALDRVSDQFGKLLTGQKTSWAEMFRGLGEQMVKTTVETEAKKGLGALGKILFPGKKPSDQEKKLEQDNWAANPHHVIIDNQAASSGGPNYTPVPTSTPVPASTGAAAGGLLQAAGGGLGGAASAVGSFIASMFRGRRPSGVSMSWRREAIGPRPTILRGGTDIEGGSEQTPAPATAPASGSSPSSEAPGPAGPMYAPVAASAPPTQPSPASPAVNLPPWLAAVASLPRFAEGGITSGPSIAGEKGRELIIPLAKVDSFIASLFRGAIPIPASMPAANPLVKISQVAPAGAPVIEGILRNPQDGPVAPSPRITIPAPASTPAPVAAIPAGGPSPTPGITIPAPAGAPSPVAAIPGITIPSPASAPSPVAPVSAGDPSGSQRGPIYPPASASAPGRPVAAPVAPVVVGPGSGPGFKLPVYAGGGTVAQTGIAQVDKGEAVIPSADSLKSAVDANTAALDRVAQKSGGPNYTARINSTPGLLKGAGSLVSSAGSVLSPWFRHKRPSAAPSGKDQPNYTPVPDSMRLPPGTFARDLSDNWMLNPHHVIVDNQLPEGSSNDTPRPTNTFVPKGSAAGRNLQEIGGILQSVGPALGAFLGARAARKTPRAEGGPVMAGMPYIVGERGPEIREFSSSGSIISNALAQRTFGGDSGDTYHVYNDCRGTDPALTEQRVYRAIKMAHDSAVGSSVRATVLRSHRVPSGR